VPYRVARDREAAEILCRLAVASSAIRHLLVQNSAHDNYILYGLVKSFLFRQQHEHLLKIPLQDSESFNLTLNRNKGFIILMFIIAVLCMFESDKFKNTDFNDQVKQNFVETQFIFYVCTLTYNQFIT
jgi:hypothetical protein